jgi:hypothetical protein
VSEPLPAFAAMTESRISLPTQNVMTGTTDRMTRRTTIALV